MKIGQAVLEKKTFKDFTILYLYIAQEQGQIDSIGKNLIVTKKLHYFNHTLYLSAIIATKNVLFSLLMYTRITIYGLVKRYVMPWLIFWITFLLDFELNFIGKL